MKWVVYVTSREYDIRFWLSHDLKQNVRKKLLSIIENGWREWFCE